ncbi:MAG: hypothetical protein E4G98_04510, partial [Promethearchaeota archaeon]
RELGGEKRLYPDTDTPPIILTEQRITHIGDTLGPYPWDLIEDYGQKYQLERELIEDLVMRGKIPLFDSLISIMPDNSMLVLRTITDMVKVLHREEKNVDNLNERHFRELLVGVSENEIAKEAMEDILRVWTETPHVSLTEAKEKAGIGAFDLSTLDTIVDELIQKNLELVQSKGRGAIGPLMGDLMNIVGRGAVDGNILSAKLAKAIGQISSPGKEKKGKTSQPNKK